jgi:hypothetical protein
MLIKVSKAKSASELFASLALFALLTAQLFEITA